MQKHLKNQPIYTLLIRHGYFSAVICPKTNAILHYCAENENAGTPQYSRLLILIIVVSKKTAALKHYCMEGQDELA